MTPLQAAAEKLIQAWNEGKNVGQAVAMLSSALRNERMKEVQCEGAAIRGGAIVNEERFL